MESTIKNPKIQRTRCDGDGDGDARDKGDRITNLPEPIIHHIFSFLETIDVIRASAVSRKWRYLWTSMPYLHFNIHTILDPSKLRYLTLNTVNEKFKDFVNWVLMSQGVTNIQRFRLSYLNFEDDYSVNRWINVAAQRNVQEIDLTMDSDKPIELPHCLVTCESLAVLKLNLRERVLRLPSVVGFSKLKSLELAWVELTDQVLARNLISSCPLLENLSLEWCIFRGFKVLDISAVNLKRLILNNLAHNEGLLNSRLKIDRPNLVSFNNLNTLAQDISFQNLSSLDNAFIFIDRCFDEPPVDQVLGNFMWKILEGLRNAKVLKLQMCFLEFLYPSLAKSGCFSISLHNLKFLKLSLGMDECHLQSLINLLKCSPNLEALEIHFEEVESDDCWEIPDMAFACLTYHLKMVQLIDVEGNDNELELVRFLLKNGHVLERMSVFWERGIDLEIQGEIMQEDISSLDNAFIYLDDLNKQPSLEEWGSVMRKFVEGLCNTKSLEVSLQFLHCELAKPDCFSTSFHNLKSLKLFMGYEWKMQSVVKMLKRSPNLEALTIHFECGWNDDCKIPNEAISCLTYHLKTVELINVEGTENALDLVWFLLKNGHVLEKMSVNWVRNLKNPGEITQKVLKFHRSSSNVALKSLEPPQIKFFNW